MPQSMLKVCPEIEALLSDNKKAAIWATSEGSKYFFNGCRSFIFSFSASFLSNFSANVVSVTVGAIALIRMLGANSAPNDLTSPSTAAFEVAILAWKGIPKAAATVLNKTTDGCCPCFKTPKYCCTTFTAPKTLISKSCWNSSVFNRWKGLRLILPGQ